MRISGINGYYNEYILNYKISGINSETTEVSKSSDVSETKQTNKTSESPEQTNAQQPSPPPEMKTPPEIEAFMAKLGLSPTNSKEGDQQAVMSKISELKASAKTDTEKQKVTNLLAEFNTIINSLEEHSGTKQTTMNFSGTDQLAALNKHFILNKS